MRSLYERLAQSTLTERPASRRTVLTLSVLTPLALVTAGALGVRHALPWAGATRERAALIAASTLMETMGSLVSIAWSARWADGNRSIEAQANEQLDLSGLVEDSSSRAELLTVFHEVRARALEGLSAGTITGDSDLFSSSTWAEPRIDSSPEGQPEGMVHVALSAPVECLIDQSIAFAHTYEFEALVDTTVSRPSIATLVRTA